MLAALMSLCVGDHCQPQPEETSIALHTDARRSSRACIPLPGTAIMNILRVTGVGRISYLEHLLEEGDYLTDCLPYRVVAWAQERHDYDGLLAEV